MNNIKKRGFGTHKDLAKIAGADGGRKSKRELDSETARKTANIRWAKYRELKAEQYEQEAKEALENYKDQRGENE